MLLVVFARPLDVLAKRRVYQKLSVLCRRVVRSSAKPREVVASPFEQVITENRSVAVEIEQMLGSERKVRSPTRRFQRPPIRAALGRAI
jgi:hypothetical protein